MSRDEIIIHIDDRQQICVEIKENGIIQAKNIDAKTLAACLTQGIIEMEAGFSSGFLPAGLSGLKRKRDCAVSCWNMPPLLQIGGMGIFCTRNFHCPGCFSVSA